MLYFSIRGSPSFGERVRSTGNGRDRDALFAMDGLPGVALGWADRDSWCNQVRMQELRYGGAARQANLKFYERR